MTIHSTFDFNFGDDYKPLSDAKLAKFRSYFENLMFIIIDEISMLSSDMLYKIHQRLTDIFRNNQPFGGVGMMLVGDLLQLKPVRGNFIFMSPRKDAYKMYFDTSSLWHLFSAIVLKKTTGKERMPNGLMS